jgi:hypothetical protein
MKFLLLASSAMVAIIWHGAPMRPPHVLLVPEYNLNRNSIRFLNIIIGQGGSDVRNER